MQITKEQLLEIIDDDSETFKTIERTFIRKLRWSDQYRYIISDGTGKFYEYFYEEPSNENVCYSSLDYESDTIELKEVFKTEKTITVYLSERPL